MKNVLSIQSHVAYGYVGNRAAIFPLQRLGLDASAINTVQFSNHTGYGKWTGEIFSAEHIKDVYEGTLDRVDDGYDALISGYAGSVAIAKVILDIAGMERKKNKDFIFSLDPVMGDVGRGFFVNPEVSAFFKETAVKEADILCPNHFEFNFLTSKEVSNSEDAKAAVLELRKKCRFKQLVITSFIDGDKDNISCLMYDEGEFYIIKTPMINFEVPPNGSGDMFSSLFAAHILRGESAKNSLEKTANAVYKVMKSTFDKKRRELDLISCQDFFVEDTAEFKATKI